LAFCLITCLLDKINNFSKRYGLITLQSELAVAWVSNHMGDGIGDIIGVDGLEVHITLKETSRDFAFVNALGNVVQKVGGLIAENKISVQNSERIGMLQGGLFGIFAHLNPRSIGILSVSHIVFNWAHSN